MSHQDRYAVFGNPIHHSKSPILQMAFAKNTQQDMCYTAECIALDGFSAAANAFFAHHGKGLNITVPFKIEAYHYAHELTDRAKTAGAVNTLIKRGDNIIGDNTDGVGFVRDVTENLQWTLTNKKILILGAGGAVRGILNPVLEQKPTSITIVNRTLKKAESLAQDFSSNATVLACNYSDLNESFDIIINGTSASLNGELPVLPSALIKKTSVCYDMMYAKTDTVFIQWAKQQGALNVSDGLGMLVCQGAESFFQWRGILPETNPVINLLRDTL
jgi:shikimate dehydrogenase